MGLLPDIRNALRPAEQPFAAKTTQRPAARPNVVFILADDLGWGDLGCFGSLHNSTPNLDRLAADGVRFTHGYSPSPTCSPTRIALYTGRYPTRIEAGLQEPIVRRDERTGIPEGHPTLPSLLKGGGYTTAMFGKWHVGVLPWFSPIRIGFDTFFGNLDGSMDYFSHLNASGEPDLYEGETPVEMTGYYTDIVTDRTVDFIEHQPTDAPFYVQVNYTSPHWPWEGPDDQAVSDKIRERMSEAPLVALFHAEGGSLDTYRVMVESLDTAVGRILDAIDAAGIAEDTIVIFASDNGGERFAFMWPFDGEKGDLEEGGIRVPIIVRWPRVIAPMQVTEEPVSTMDLTATFLDAAGVAPDPGYPLDGVSWMPWLLGGALPERDLLWRTREQGAVRRGKYKMLYNRTNAKRGWGKFRQFGDARVHLYDVTVDGRERAELASELPELASELFAVWQEHDRELLPYPSEDPVGNILENRAHAD